MARGAKPGERRGGRSKGVPNRATRELKERIARMGCDPFEVLALVAMNQLPCGVCRGAKKTRWQPGNSDKPGMRDCQSCWGSGLERCSPKERESAAAELAQYLEPKRKAIEHRAPEGEGKAGWKMVFEVPVI